MVQKRVLGRVLAGKRTTRAGPALRLLDRFRLLQRVSAYLVGVGIRPEHVRSPVDVGRDPEHAESP
jgi:hypothetical protein